jgi:N-methylhydantoinase B/oxoprolinase/acetone carboxylase alpha subunit
VHQAAAAEDGERLLADLVAAVGGDQFMRVGETAAADGLGIQRAEIAAFESTLKAIDLAG